MDRFTWFLVLLVVAVEGVNADPVNVKYLVKYDGYYATDKRNEFYKNADVEVEKRINHFSDFDTVIVGNLSVARVVEQFLKFQIKEIENVYKTTDNDVRTLKKNKNWNSNKRTTTSRHLDIRQIADLLRADRLWLNGFKGQGIDVAIFDTGLTRRRTFFRNVKEVVDFTGERNAADQVGHGTFVAGVIASSRKRCSGIAPLANLHVYKVFTSKQVSTTAWFLDAFNRAIQNRIHVINLSIGGPDFTDEPFVQKVKEVTENGIIIISASGNDGPVFGTLNNPADDANVIGVSSINLEDKISRFSSRGMTTFELPGGYGRLKPDVVTFGEQVFGAALKGGCRMLSGTSVAAPVVTGAVALLLSSIDEKERRNVAMVKQALIEGALRVDKDSNMFEQGAGKMDIAAAFYHLQKATKQISIYPPYIDYLECPYFWPYCTQPLYHGGLPVVFNLTLLNSFGSGGKIVGEPRFEPLFRQNGRVLDVYFEFSREFDPFSAYLAVHVKIKEEGKGFEGLAAAKVTVTVETKGVLSNASILMRFQVVPSPDKRRRILWDQFRNMRYPFGYFPRDDLRQRTAPLDWVADHPHTNYKALYEHLRSLGYFVEVSGRSLACEELDLQAYGVYLLVDPEDEFFPAEVELLKDAAGNGTSLFVFGDWYNRSLIQKIQFLDDDDDRMWTPETGGANVPGLNVLLEKFGFGLSDIVVDGTFYYGSQMVRYTSGSTILAAPKGSFLGFADLKDTAEELITGSKVVRKSAVFGMSQFGQGLVTVFGDSGCLEDGSCFGLMDELLTGKDQLLDGQGNAKFYPEGDLASWLVQSDIFPDLTSVRVPKHELSESYMNHSKVISFQEAATGLVQFKQKGVCLSWISANPMSSDSTKHLILPVNFGPQNRGLDVLDVERLLGPRLLADFDTLLEENAKGLPSDDYFLVDLELLPEAKLYFVVLVCCFLVLVLLIVRPKTVMVVWTRAGMVVLNIWRRFRGLRAAVV